MPSVYSPPPSMPLKRKKKPKVSRDSVEALFEDMLHQVERGVQRMEALERDVASEQEARSREAWEAAEVAASIDESDREIYERLFTLYDKRGNNEVHVREFLSGLATIVNATLEERLHVAMEMWDEKGTGYLSQAEVQSCFLSMSRTCDYFGDEKMSYEQIEELVQSMFDTCDANLVDLKMRYRDHISDFAVHPIMEIFIGRQTLDS